MMAFERPFVLRAVGASLIGMGGLLMLAVVGYVGVGIYGESRLAELVVPESEISSSTTDLQRDLFVPGIAPSSPPSTAPDQTSLTTPSAATVSTQPGGTSTTSVDTNTPGGETPLEQSPAPASDATTSDQTSGGLVPVAPGARFEFAPLRSEATGSSTGSAIGAKFDPIDWSRLAPSIGEEPRAQRMIIPAIGLDSNIVELGTRWDGPNLQWETADHAVGHHVGTPHPAERGIAVFSGHINSPIRGEGSIFSRLPDVASLLREGRTIDIILESEEGRYLYRATSTDVVVPEDVQVFRTSQTPGLTLVTCVPATHYTHRFLVNAVLVGHSSA